MMRGWQLAVGIVILSAWPVMAGTRSVHVFVALADNRHQGIVPVPATLGNGEDPRNNLYWGALYGVKTYLRKSNDWALLVTIPAPSQHVLERCVFRNAKTDVMLTADAYRGSAIKHCVTDFLMAAGGYSATNLVVSGKQARLHGGSDMLVYVGHNGLMDFSVDQIAVQNGSKDLDAIVLACKSKPYFGPRLSRLKARAVLLTTGLMAPEAYTLEAVLEPWAAGSTAGEIRERAARAYHRYQRCGMNGARKLFFSEGQ